MGCHSWKCLSRVLALSSLMVPGALRLLLALALFLLTLWAGPGLLREERWRQGLTGQLMGTAWAQRRMLGD